MAQGYDYNTIARIQQANDIIDVVSEHVNLSRKGGEMVGLCPFHEDHRPSLYVNPSKQIFKCFACGAGGDVLKFVQMRENLTFPQAIERLAQRADIEIKPRKYGRAKKTSGQSQIDPNRLAKLNEWAAKLFQRNLLKTEEGKKAREYLRKRGFDKDAIERWRLGFCLSGDNLLKAAKRRGISTRELSGAGLIIQRAGSYHDKFSGRLMFTITDVTGRVTGFGGRSLDDSGPKYINSPQTVLFDKSNCLYGLEQARHPIVSAGTAVIVEGYTDCIMAHSKGCSNVVATLGTSLTEGHGRLLRRYAKSAVLIFDSDTAGIEAANRALDLCLSQKLDIKLTTVPNGKDPCEYLSSAGKKSFEELISGATDVFEFKWNRLGEKFSIDGTISGRKAAIDEFIQSISAGLRSGRLTPIERGLIVNRLSKLISASPADIESELSRRSRYRSRTSVTGGQGYNEEGTELGEGLAGSVQRELLEIFLNEPAFFEDVKDTVSPELFDVGVLSEIAESFFKILETEPQPGLGQVLAAIESKQASSTAVWLAEEGRKKGNLRARLTGACEAIKKAAGRNRVQGRDAFKSRDEEIEFLRQIHERTGKQDVYNPGML